MSKRVLLIQVREPIFAEHEVKSILKYVDLNKEDLIIHNAIHQEISSDIAKGVDAIIFGGSGECNVSKNQPDHIENLLTCVRTWVEQGIPFLGICYGGHILAKAFGGEVVWAEDRKEVGNAVLSLQETAIQDKLFDGLPNEFNIGVGHIDAISTLPKGAISLAKTDKVDHHAFRLDYMQPVYGVQFHPELNKPEHIERIRLVYQETGDKYFKSENELNKTLNALEETPESTSLLQRFIDLV